MSDSTVVVSPDSAVGGTHGPLNFTSADLVGNWTHNVVLSKIYDLNFGGIFCGSSPGTVIVSPSGTVSYTGNVVAHNGVSGFLARPAVVQLNITNHDHCTQDDHESNDDNEYNRDEDDDNHTNDTRTSYNRHGVAVSITMPSSSTLTRTGGTATMTADNFNFTRTKGNFSIGATLHVAGNQTPGPYAGTFLVTVICQ